MDKDHGDKVIGLPKKIFEKTYAAHSGIIYGIAGRIASEGGLAEQILTQVFLTLNAQGQLNAAHPIAYRYLFAATANAARTLLSEQFAADEINARICKEQKRILAHRRKV